MVPRCSASLRSIASNFVISLKHFGVFEFKALAVGLSSAVGRLESVEISS